MIVSKPFFETFHKTNKFVIHAKNCGLISTSEPQNATITAYVEGMHSRIKLHSKTKINLKWDFLANGILNPLLDDNPEVTMLDMKKSQCFSEWNFGFGYGLESYRKFYLENSFNPQDLIAHNYLGLIMLHNSWMPDSFKKMTEKEFLATNTTLARLLNFLLDDKTSAETIAQISAPVRYDFELTNQPKFSLNHTVTLKENTLCTVNGASLYNFIGQTAIVKDIRKCKHFGGEYVYNLLFEDGGQALQASERDIDMIKIVTKVIASNKPVNQMNFNEKMTLKKSMNWKNHIFMLTPEWLIDLIRTIKY
jgi:hypothetical protein